MRLAVTAAPQPFLLRERVVALTERGNACDAARLLAEAGSPEGDEGLAATVARWFALTPEKRRAVEAALEREANQGAPPAVLRRPIDEHAKVLVIEGRVGAETLPDRAGPLTAMLKYPTAFADPGAAILLPRGARSFDVNVAVGLVIGKETASVAADVAGRSIAGFTLLADVTDRTAYVEEARTNNGLLAKNLAGLSLIGPSLVLPADGKLSGLPEIWLKLNGEVRQSFKPADLLWTAEEAIARWSEAILDPGDIVALGAALAIKPRLAPVPLSAGDRLEIGCSAIGTLNAVVSAAT
jgi:2-keto-4-pentenoate hydratase/2-oxohepta-3-ene-1,7-dioic acid hydratase in catechol pathway